MLDSLGDIAHELKEDLLEVTRRLDLSIIDCSENATDGLLRENRHLLAAWAEVPTWSWDGTVAIVDRVDDGINMGMNIEEMEQNPSMDIEQVERSLSNVDLSFMKPKDKIEAEEKSKKKGRWRP
ncbi:hypothetical protein V6N13_110967 [Hibiscus sabdariffa]|uniref:Uncharacterized protein n=1 Tax=Hibiscus sabdariffa TaxID=183260 RepID=A0ABR2TIY4_9ROSI